MANMLILIRNIIPSALLVPILLIVGPSSLAAQGKSSKVCLVLSGGGARGASHIGVLKVLERERIPIDCIVGTSFGAFVGGLYSIGYSASEIEKILTSQDWSGIFSDAPQRHLMPILERRNTRYQMQLSFKGWNPGLPSGLWEGQRITESLDLLTTSRMLDAHNDFDKLPIQFRAVATNLLDGKAFIFKQGRMTEALRSSMAIPLVFTPVEKDGMLLADGGLVDNLPVDIALSLGADIVIAVDATSPILKKDQIQTFINVIDQAISLDMERNVEANRKLANILLKPDLEKFTFNDYYEIPEIIGRGEQEAKKRLGEIKSLVSGVTPRLKKALPVSVKRIINSISFEGLTKIKPSRLTMQAHLYVHAGDALDLSALAGDQGRLYATGLFDGVDYRLDPLDENNYILVFLMKESASKFLGLGVRYDSDHDFVALAEFTARQLFGGSSSATISSQFGGIEDYFASLRLIPSPATFLFIEPKVEMSKLPRLEIRNKELFSTFTDRREGGQLIAGSSLFRLFEVEGGYHRERVKIQGGSGIDAMSISPATLAGLTLSVYRDTLDSRELPLRGAALQILIDKQTKALGSDFNYSRWQAEYKRFFSFSDKSIVQINAVAGFTRGQTPFYDLFCAGGYSFAERASRQFPGLEQDEIRANQIAVMGAGYRRQIFSNSLDFVKRGYLVGAYNVLMYSNHPEPPYRFNFLNGAGIGLTMDTLVGPVRIMGGWAEEGRVHFYISIGPRF
jgi:NTE family protein